jgi:hypothetical protein
MIGFSCFSCFFSKKNTLLKHVPIQFSENPDEGP